MAIYFVNATVKLMTPSGDEFIHEVQHCFDTGEVVISSVSQADQLVHKIIETCTHISVEAVCPHPHCEAAVLINSINRL